MEVLAKSKKKRKYDGFDERLALKARFLRCVSSLRYLGFVRAYGQSEDYVEKLVFI